MPPVPPELFGLNISEIAALCRVSLKTARRWKLGTACPPRSAILLLKADLGIFDPAWEGWTVRGGWMYSPEGWKSSPGDVRATNLQRSQIAIYQAENRRLKAELENANGASIENQPTAEAWALPANWVITA
jgi:hypothetical protein